MWKRVANSGKRAKSRLRVRLPVRLVTRNGERRTTLLDLSETGACIEYPFPPGYRGDVLLQWCGFEAFGSVVWTHSRLAGVSFYDPVPVEVILATRRINDVDRLPEEHEIKRRHAREWVAGGTGSR